MVKKLFWADPYCTRLSTHIASSNGAEVTLEETIFYAFSGGQESDAGSISGKQVLQARKDGLEIIYTLEENHGLNAGDEVEVVIDWARRYRLMRLHFAAEIVLELFYRNLKGVQKIGAHIAEDKSRIDFAWDSSIAPLFPDLRQQAMRLIQGDHSITSAFSDEAAQRRYWEIEGFARVACGGTHLKKTGEVGEIDLKRKNIGKGKERVEIFLVNSTA